VKIKRIISQHRRDFWAIYECEHCGHVTSEKSGYDDANFHNNVIPKMKCEKCGEVASEDYRPLAPKYEPWEDI
jgi:transcription elongation factor Elf1